MRLIHYRTCGLKLSGLYPIDSRAICWLNWCLTLWIWYSDFRWGASLVALDHWLYSKQIEIWKEMLVPWFFVLMQLESDVVARDKIYMHKSWYKLTNLTRTKTLDGKTKLASHDKHLNHASSTQVVVTLVSQASLAGLTKTGTRLVFVRATLLISHLFS